MTCDKEHYWNLCGFLNDEEVHQVWEIIGNSLDRAGWVGTADDAELSMRLYDPNLKQNIDSETEYDPEPFEVDHPLFHNHQKKSSRPWTVSKLSIFCGNGVEIVYYTYMEINDQFQITLSSQQYDLLTDIFSSAADLDLPPTEDDAFDSLWDAIINAEHQIKFEEAKS